MNFIKTTLFTLIAILSFTVATQARRGLIELIRTHDKAWYISAIISAEEVMSITEYHDDTRSNFMPLRKSLREAMNRTDSEFVIVELAVNYQDQDTQQLREQLDRSIELAKQEAADLKELIFVILIDQPDLRNYVCSQLQGYICR